MFEPLRTWASVIVAAVAAIPFAVLVVVVTAKRRVRAGLRRGAAWTTASAEVGIVVGTLPWIWMILTPRPG